MSTETADSQSSRAFIAELGRHELTAHWALVVRFVATSVARTLTTVGVVLLIREFLGSALGEAREPSWLATLAPDTALWVMAGALLATFVAGAALNYDNQVVLQRLVRLFELSLTERLLTHLLRLPVAFFDRQQHGDILESVRQDVTKTRSTVMAVVQLAIQATQVLALFVSLLLLSPVLALTSTPMLLAAAAPVWWVARRVRQRSFRTRRLGYVLSDLILQVVRGIRLVKVYAGEAAETENVVRKARRYFEETIAATRLRSLGQVALETLGGLSIVLVTVVGGFQVMEGTLSAPQLVAFLIAARSLHGPLNQLNEHYMEMQKQWASVHRIRELLALQPDVRDCAEASPWEEPLESIAFDGVRFAYRAERPVLHDLTFSVRAGEQIGIVGPSGAGKTTLIGLVARFHDPTAGRVLVNGRDLRSFRLDDVYARIAIVTQDPFLFATSVRENIRYGRPSATDHEVERAARAAEVHDEIVALPDGYDTLVGIGGRVLSGGQIQRVNVARAFLKDAPILLLDEATSSLDSIAETRLQAAFHKLRQGRTTFVIAHRLSTLRHADRIVVLEDGHAVGIGTHEALMLSCPLYRTLWKTQEVSGQGQMGRDDAAGGFRDDYLLGASRR